MLTGCLEDEFEFLAQAVERIRLGQRDGWKESGTYVPERNRKTMLEEEQFSI